MRARILAISLFLCLVGSVFSADERFETLLVSGNSYSNVVILSKTPTDVFFTHSYGMLNVKVRDLNDRARRQLGYDHGGDDAEVVEAREFEPIKFEADPRIKELQSKFAGDYEGKIRAMAGAAVAVALGIVAVLYLFFCYCTKRICEKAGSPAPFMSWIPGLQLAALFKAAGLPKWAISALFAPSIFKSMAPYIAPQDLSMESPQMMAFIGWAILSVLISFITSIIFFRRLCMACNKSSWLAIPLLLPLANILTFAYLAFSRNESEDQINGQNPGYVSLG